MSTFISLDSDKVSFTKASWYIYSAYNEYIDKQSLDPTKCVFMLDIKDLPHVIIPDHYTSQSELMVLVENEFGTVIEVSTEYHWYINLIRSKERDGKEYFRFCLKF